VSREPEAANALAVSPLPGPAARAAPALDAKRQLAVASLTLVGASYAFRLPALLNARSTNSDAAVVGLQAMHILRGELSPFLWGSGYQTSADSFVAAAAFALLGPSPVALMLSALTLHVVATLLVFTTLARRFVPSVALLLSLPLVFTPSSVHSYALYPPRQLSLTLALAAFAAVDRAASVRDGELPRRGRLALAAGGALSTLAIAADPYPLVLLPLAALYALLVAAASPSARARVGAAGAYAAGAAVGLLPFLVLHRLPGAKSGPMGLTTSMLAHHARLLVEECLPWALSYKVYFARNVMDYAPWDAPAAFTVTGAVGALVLGGAVVVALASPWIARVPKPTRRLGFVAALTFPTAIAGFLVSVMVMDHFSMRYLAVLTLMTPFALAPVASLVRARTLVAMLAPHLVASAIGGWVGYGPFVRGALPAFETPELRDDYVLHATLRARGIRYAVADYWASYRLTFLFREDIIVVPRNAGEDRYAPYRRELETQPAFAYVYDPGRSREDLAEAERELRTDGAAVERLEAGRLVVFLVTRPPSSPAP